jgi:hypothetical protein
MKVILLMISEKVKANSLGKMEEYMMDNGKMESNMEEASLYPRMVRRELVNGKMEGKSNGSTDKTTRFV